MGAKYKLSLSMIIVCGETGEKKGAKAELCVNSLPEKMQRKVDKSLADGLAWKEIGFFLNDIALGGLVGHAAAQRCYLHFRTFDGGKDPLGGENSVCACRVDSIKELD